MISDLDNYVFVCPNWGEQFSNLQDYLDYSEGQHDYWISDYLGCSYHFPSVDSYQQWVRTELIASGKTLYEWRREQQISSVDNIIFQIKSGIIYRFRSPNIRKLIRKAKSARTLTTSHWIN